MNHARSVGLLALFLIFSISAIFAVPASAQQISGFVATSYNYDVLSGTHAIIGTQRALMILVDFVDVRHNKSASEVENVAVNQLNAYYREVSYGKVSITAQTYGWYTVNHSMSHYGHDSSKPGDDDGLPQLASDAAALLPDSVNLTSFKFLVIVHAGKDQAVDQHSVKSDEIWSKCYCAVFPSYASPFPVFAHGRFFADYAFLSEFDGLGAYAHESGHLFGLPDLYDTETGYSYVGFWSLIDRGDRCCGDAASSTPSYIGGWGAALLGWLAPSIEELSIVVSAFDVMPLESRNATALLVPVSPSTYYFVEYRTQTGRDSHLPDTGVLIYFVDERLETGKGIVKLVNPKTGKLCAAEKRIGELNEAVFKPSHRFRDTSHQIFLAFWEGKGIVTALYSTQELRESPVQTAFTTSQKSVNAVYGDRFLLTGSLRDQNGTALAGQTVEIAVFDPILHDWSVIGAATTNELGEASFDFALTFALGDHSFRLLYPGARTGAVWYTSSYAELTVNVLPAVIVLTMSKAELSFGESTIIVSAADIHGEPLPNALVAVYVNDVQKGIAMTDRNGKASFHLQFASAGVGSHSVTARASAANYLPSEISESMFVVPIWLIVLFVVAIAASLAALKLKRLHDSTKPAEAGRV